MSTRRTALSIALLMASAGIILPATVQAASVYGITGDDLQMNTLGSQYIHSRHTGLMPYWGPCYRCTTQIESEPTCTPGTQNHVLAPHEAAQTILEEVEKRIAEKQRKTEEKIQEWLNKPDEEKIIYSDGTVRISYDFDIPVDEPRVEAEAERLSAFAKNNVIAWNQKFLPLIEAYENGGNRPKWGERWIGSRELLQRIATEDNARSEKRKQEFECRKLNQLTEAVKHFGSDSQKERWEADVMPRREVLDLIWNRWVEPLHNAGLEPLHNAWHIAGYEDGFSESKKETLTDSQWAIVKKVKAVMPEAELEYYHQYSDDEDVQGCDLIRISQKIGEYDFECDIVFPED